MESLQTMMFDFHQQHGRPGLCPEQLMGISVPPGSPLLEQLTCTFAQPYCLILVNGGSMLYRHLASGAAPASWRPVLTVIRYPRLSAWESIYLRLHHSPCKAASPSQILEMKLTPPPPMERSSALTIDLLYMVVHQASHMVLQLPGSGTAIPSFPSHPNPPQVQL